MGAGCTSARFTTTRLLFDRLTRKWKLKSRSHNGLDSFERSTSLLDSSRFRNGAPRRLVFVK
jgi:hypothetical protein